MLSKLSRINFEFSHEDAPITRLYTKKELKQLFADFKKCRFPSIYTKATQTPRRGLLSEYNYVFVPLYNLFTQLHSQPIGHAAIVVAVK